MTPPPDEPHVIHLDAADVVALYAELFGCTERQAAINCAVPPAEGAVAPSATHAHYEDADSALQAPALAHGIAESQPFIEGNKRVALAAMRTFLGVNGYNVTASQADRAS